MTPNAEVQEKIAPSGIVVLITDSVGREMAHAGDFDRAGYGGFTLADAQTMRAKAAALRDLMHRLANEDLANAIISSHTIERVYEEMARKAGFRMHIVNVGGKHDRD